MEELAIIHITPIKESLDNLRVLLWTTSEINSVVNPISKPDTHDIGV
jgi:hypothetical protein